MGLYEEPLSLSLLVLGWGLCYPYVWYYVGVKSRCVIFSFSGPCELLLLRCFIASRT